MLAMTNVKYLLAVGSLLFTLVGCGGGGNDGIDDGGHNDDGEVIAEKSIGGIWNGNVSSVDGTTSIPSTGVVAEDGRFFFFSPLEFDVGTFITSENSFTSDLKAYVPFGEAFAIVNGEISGSFIEREQISGTSRFEDGTSASTFLYNYDPTYETPSSLSSIAGLYGVTDEEGAYTETFTIDAAGAVTGFNTDGCVANGEIKLVDSRYTIYDIQLTVTACETDRNLSGLAAYQPGGENDSGSLLIFADDGSEPFIGVLIGQ
jgi:hypothetical protein